MKVLLKKHHMKEPVVETADIEMLQDQGGDLGNTKDQPNVEENPMDDCIIAQAEKHPLMFNELISTPIDFLENVMHNLKIDTLTYKILVGPTFNLLKGTCKSFVELEYHFEECYKAVTDRLDLNNPESHEYPLDHSKPLPLIEDQGRQVVLAYYFFNNDLKYLKGRSSSRKDDKKLHKFKEGDFPRLNLHDIKDLLLLLVQKNFSNLEKDVIFDLNVALRMFTRRIVILKWDIPLVSVEVHRYDIEKSKSDNKGKVATGMELVLEQTQQGTSYEVSIRTGEVEELKRKVKIKVILNGDSPTPTRVVDGVVQAVAPTIANFESYESVPTSPVHDRYKSSEGYHDVPPPYTETFMPPKPDLVFHDAPTASETITNVLNVKHNTSKPNKDFSQSNRPSTHIIDDWVSKSEDKYKVVLTRSRLVPLNVARHVTTVGPQTHVKHQRPVKHIFNKPHSSIRRPINHRPAPKYSNFRQKVTTAKPKKVNVVKGTKGNRIQVSNGLGPQNTLSFFFDVQGNPQQALKDKGVIDSVCSKHMTGNITYLSDFEEINEGYVAFGGNLKGGKITGKGKIKTGKLDCDDVYFVKELKFNLFSVSQMCNKMNNVLFTNTKCVVLSFDFKLPDDNHVLLRVPRKNNMYNVDLKNIVPSGDLTCLFAKATLYESNLLHRRVLVTKPHNKTPYELLLGRTPSIGFMRHFRCPVTILNTLDPLGKFDGKADEGFLVGYSINKKAFRETLHINFLENQPNVARNGPTWLFDIDTLTQSMNYQLVAVGNQPNHNADIQGNFDAGKVVKEAESAQQYVLLPLWSTGSKDSQNTDAEATFNVKENESEVHASPNLSTRVRDLSDEFEEFSINSPNRVNAASAPVTAVGPNSTNCTNSFIVVGSSDNAVSPNFEIGEKSSFVDPSQYLDDPPMPALEDIIYSDDEEDVSEEADFSNLETSITISPIPTTTVHKDHHVTQIIGHTQEKGIDYEEVFAPVARIEAIRLFLTYASFIGFMVYQMDVKSDFLDETIEEEVYVCQPLGFEDPDYPDKVYKVVKSLYGLHQALRAWYETLANYLLENGFQRGKINQTLFIKKQKGDILLVQVYVDDIIFGSTNKELCKAFKKLMTDKFQMCSMGELNFFLGLHVKQKDNGIFISQDKYVAEILRKFVLTDGKLASTPIDIEKPLLKDSDGEDVDIHIHRYIKGKPHLGLWYPKDSLFNLVAYSDSDYAGASLDTKSTTGGCRLISWQCKKQTVIPTSSTEVEYVAAVSCCPQVLWIQNQLLDYGRMEEDVTVVKDINVAKSKATAYDDEEVTMSMAQTLINIKADKARILDEQMAKRLQDKEIKQAAAREGQEKEDL
nr:putative ribonuclease H-like domain-containing protein [Tanacetum cinerariifolium]